MGHFKPFSPLVVELSSCKFYLYLYNRFSVYEQNLTNTRKKQGTDFNSVFIRYGSVTQLFHQIN